MRPAVVVVGSALGLVGLVRLVGAERLAGVLRALDRESGLFTTWGTGLYVQVAPALLRGFYRRVATDVAAVAPREGAFLDVGTGPGLLALEIARQRPDLEVVGVDISPPMLDKARANANVASLAQRVRFVLGDATHLPFPDCTFDLALSTLSLHHWSDLVAALCELHRVLRPGGRLWLYDMGAVSYSARQLSVAAALTPFAAQSIERTPVRAGPLPVALYVRFAIHRK